MTVTPPLWVFFLGEFREVAGPWTDRHFGLEVGCDLVLLHPGTQGWSVVSLSSSDVLALPDAAAPLLVTGIQNLSGTEVEELERLLETA